MLNQFSIIFIYIRYFWFFFREAVLNDHRRSQHVNRKRMQRIIGHERNSRSLNPLLSLSKIALGLLGFVNCYGKTDLDEKL